MEKRYILRKVGKCGGCVYENNDRRKDPCIFCERNEVLFNELLSDSFEKREEDPAEIPRPKVTDDTSPIEQNRKLLSDWGVSIDDEKIT